MPPRPDKQGTKASALSGLLLFLFGGITDRLIPLFAIGAFTAFSFSQVGMVVHWHKSQEAGAKFSLAFNAIGAAATVVTLVIIAASKFREGAWLTILIIPPLVFLFLRIQRYQRDLGSETTEDDPLEAEGLVSPIIVVPLKRLSRVVRKGLLLAITLSDEVHAVQIIAEEMNADDLTQKWPALVAEPLKNGGHSVPRLTVIRSPYREFYGPLLRYIREISQKHPDRQIAVVIPELVERRWYNFMLRHRATLLKEMLLMYGSPQIIVMTTPWYRTPGQTSQKVMSR